MSPVIRIALLFLTITACHSAVAAEQPYFQQEVRYQIDVRLDDVRHFLHGQERFVYRNNSPDTLDRIYLHLWPNAYKDENTVLGRIYDADADMRLRKALTRNGSGYIDSLDFTSAGTTLSWTFLPDTEDVALLKLNQPLSPGDSVVIETPFRVKIPSARISRFGHEGQAYFITQWYPKPAVYDRGGWKYVPYVDKGEFYSEYGTFDVNITLPQNYVVGATGELVNGEKETEWLNEKALETMSIDVFNKDSMAFPPSSSNTKTLHYHQERVHDFAWFADKRWNVLKTSMELPGSRERVVIWAFFTNRQGDWWMKAPQYMEQTVRDYSRWIGDYPYRQVTAVDVGNAEGSDMEYPMITAIGSAGSAIGLETVLVHEVGHNWFYGILGNDERRHPWLDEGMNSFFDERYLFTNYAKDSTKMDEYFNRLGRWGKWTKNTHENSRIKQYLRYAAEARLNNDQSLSLRSEDFTLRNYGGMVYGKTSLGFQYLLAYLGDSLFDAAMHNYFDEWKFRHPRPQDLRASFEQSTGKDLGWLFDGWLGSSEKLDYSVTSLRTKQDSFALSLKNREGIAGPVAIGISDTSDSYHCIWIEGFEKDTVVRLAGKPKTPHLLDPDRWMPELNRKNNSIRSSGVFRKTEPLQLRLLTDVEDPDRTQLYLAPAAGWNLYNGVMTGIVLHNVGFPQKNLEFAMMPMYAWGTKDLAGGGFANYKILPASGWFKEIRLQSGIQHYSLGEDVYERPSTGLTERNTMHFTRWENQVEFRLRNNTPRNRVSEDVRIRHIRTWQDLPIRFSPNYTHTVDIKDFFELRLRRSNDHPWHYRRSELTVLTNDEVVRATCQFKFKTPYENPVKGLHWRLFAGVVSTTSKSTYPTDYDLQLSGRSGTDDFLFDQVFLGRNETEGILSKQFVMNDGGFATFAPTRFSESWMVTAGLKADVPGKLPVQGYFTVGCFAKSNEIVEDAVRFPYEAGLAVTLAKNVFTVYFPIVFSPDIRAALDNAGLLNFGEQIRFEFDLRALNPLDRINR